MSYKNSGTKIVLRACEFQVGLHALNFGIADIRTVQKAEQVQESQHGNKTEVDLAKRLLRIHAAGINVVSCPVWVVVLRVL